MYQIPVYQSPRYQINVQQLGLQPSEQARQPLEQLAHSLAYGYSVELLDGDSGLILRGRLAPENTMLHALGRICRQAASTALGLAMHAEAQLPLDALRCVVLVTSRLPRPSSTLHACALRCLALLEQRLEDAPRSNRLLALPLKVIRVLAAYLAPRDLISFYHCAQPLRESLAQVQQQAQRLARAMALRHLAYSHAVLDGEPPLAKDCVIACAAPQFYQQWRARLPGAAPASQDQLYAGMLAELVHAQPARASALLPKMTTQRARCEAVVAAGIGLVTTGTDPSVAHQLVETIVPKDLQDEALVTIARGCPDYGSFLRLTECLRYSDKQIACYLHWVSDSRHPLAERLDALARVPSLQRPKKAYRYLERSIRDVESAECLISFLPRFTGAWERDWLYSEAACGFARCAPKQAMEMAACVTDEARRKRTYSELLRSFASLDEHSLEAYLHCAQQSGDVHWLQCCAEYLAPRDAQRARDLVKRAGDDRLWVQAGNDLGPWLLLEEQAEDPEQLLNVFTRRYTKPERSSSLRLLEILVAKDRWDLAQRAAAWYAQCAEELQGIWGALARHYLACGYVEKAEALVQREDDWSERATSYRHLALHYLGAGKQADMKRCLQAFCKYWPKYQDVRSLISALAQCGDYACIQDLLDQAARPQERDSHLTRFIRYDLAPEEDPFKWLEQIHSAWDHDFTVDRLSEAAMQRGEPERAYQLLERLHDLGGFSLAEHQLRLRLRESSAQQVYEERASVLAELLELKAGETRERGFSQVLCAALQQQDVALALRCLRRLRHTGQLKPEGWQSLAQLLLEQDDAQACLRILDDGELKRHLQLEVARILAPRDPRASVDWLPAKLDFWDRAHDLLTTLALGLREQDPLLACSLLRRIPVRSAAACMAYLRAELRARCA